MSEKVGRREFVKAGTAATLVAGAPAAAFGQGPSVLVRKATPPVVISSSNGHEHKNGGPRTCVEEAWQRIAKGEDVLDSLIAGVNIVELDPADTSVGYGGLPNADGVVQLDSCCMHGPLKRAGGVASLEGVRTPARVAKAVLDHTDHHLLVGPGAQAFARNMGFAIEADLNTDRSRSRWLEWKRRVDPGHYLDPKKRVEAGEAASRSMVRDGLLDAHHRYGTINCDGVSAKGEVCGVTTTSGLAFKIPGRVGDSPILGAGLWVDDEVGAAGSTGRGEANLYNLSSFFIVEELRRGRAAKDAGIAALQRVKAATLEKRLLDRNGLPNFQLVFYVLTKKGEYAGVSMWGQEGKNPERFAVCSESGPALVACEPLHEGAPAE
jgi:N4-(beta-N-acetylglucosaminyl)-L-asparaginase